MINVYQPTVLLSKDDFHKIESAFSDSWSKDTTYPDLKDEWSEENKALGQCAPTSLIIYDLFGGMLIYDKVNFHIWNEFPDGTQQDFSREQFKDERIFTIYKYKTRDEVLYDESAKRTDMLSRYTLLKKRFLEELHKQK